MEGENASPQAFTGFKCLRPYRIKSGVESSVNDIYTYSDYLFMTS